MTTSHAQSLVDETTIDERPVKPVGAGLPLAVAAILLGTKWETPLAQLRPRTY